MKNKSSFNVFELLFFCFFIMVWIGLAFSLTESIYSFYSFLTATIFLSILFILKKYSMFSFNIDDISIKSTYPLLVIGILSFLYIYIQSPYSFMDALSVHSLGLNNYSLRVDFVSVRFYWVFEAFVRVLACLSIVYMFKKKWLLMTVSLITYVIFYVMSLQKFPIAILFLYLSYVIFFTSKINFRKLILFVSGSFSILVYFYFTIFKSFEYDKLRIFFSAIINRITDSSGLITYVYTKFLSEGIQLGTATLPKRFLFLFDLNFLSSNRIRLPTYVTELNPSFKGGTNTAFFTEGIANFGAGFDVIYIVFFILFITVIIRLSVFFNKSYRNLYILVVSFFIVNVVNVQMWSVFDSLLLIFIFFSINSFLCNFKRKSDDIYNSH